MSNKLQQLHDLGVSVWLDYLSRDLIRTGKLQKFIDDDGLRGETSNPTIFQKAISEGHAYDEQITELARQGRNPEEICWGLMVRDVQTACDIFRPLYDASKGGDGYVSLELSPLLSLDTEGSLAQARDLWPRVGRPNIFLKVPATREGLPVIEQLIYEGVNVNVTLLFAVQRYEEVMEAYLRGLERRVEEGRPIEGIASVASFFVSRVDTECDKRLDKIAGDTPDLAARAGRLKGRNAVANAQVAYEKYEEVFGGERFARLQAKGARVQRPLWASTSTKNPSYRQTIYVDDLIGPDCVNTMPEETMDAFREHGTLERTLLSANFKKARETLEELAAVGVDLADVTLHTLIDEGVQKFADSYNALLGAVAKEREKLLSRA